MESRHKTKVFLLYRPGCSLLDEVKLFLQQIGLPPLILPSEGLAGGTILHRFESYASDAYAIALFSTRNRVGVPQADRTLLFQLGFLVGKLGRKNVAALFQNEIELPTECAQILSIPIDDIGIWKFALMRDLAVAGFAIRQELAEAF